MDDILAQERLVGDYLLPWVDEIKRERDPLGACAVWWAVENLVPMRQLSQRPHALVFYETLLVEPERQLQLLTSWLGLPDNRVSPSVIHRPTRMSRPGISYQSTMDRLSSWRRELSAEGQQRILAWAQRLGVEWYNDGPMPIGGHQA